MILVTKRDGGKEPFDAHKLAGAMWRVMEPFGATFSQASDLAGAIELYLTRSGAEGISSSALFEMTVKVLRRVGMDGAGEAMEAHRIWRSQHRPLISVRHDSGNSTLLDKSWLAQFAGRSWHVSPAVARIIAAMVEDRLLASVPAELSRGQVVDMLNDYMVQFGLADAVPVNSGL